MLTYVDVSSLKPLKLVVNPGNGGAVIENNADMGIAWDGDFDRCFMFIVARSGGEAVQSKSWHSFIKEKMREVDAVFGGEMSAHHYFRNFSYADSGMIPWLLVAELLSTTGKSLSDLVGERQSKYPTSGEINREVADTASAIQAVRERYAAEADAIDEVDGISLDFGDWRFNLHGSNTEPVIRLNVESRADKALMQTKVREILSLLDDLA